MSHFIKNMDAGQVKEEIEELLSGEMVTKEIHEELTYQGLYDSVENIWSVLFMTGYLTYKGKPKDGKYQLLIPNMEIRNIFTKQIMREDNFHTIYRYGIACYKKKCRVQVEKEKEI